MIKIILCGLLITALFISGCKLQTTNVNTDDIPNFDWNEWNDKQIEKEKQEKNIIHPPIAVKKYNDYISSLSNK